MSLLADDFLDLAVDQADRTLAGFAVPSGTDRLLVVKVALRDNTLRSVSSVTYGGAGLTRYGGAGAGGEFLADTWYLVNPTAGSGDVVVTFDAQVFRSAVFVEVYDDIDQSTPIEAAGSATGTGTSFAPSVTVITSGAALTSVAWSNVGSSGASALTATSPATAINYAGESQSTDAAGSAWNSSVSSGSQSIAWATTASEPYAAHTVALRPSSGVATVSQLALTGVG